MKYILVITSSALQAEGYDLKVSPVKILQRLSDKFEVLIWAEPEEEVNVSNSSYSYVYSTRDIEDPTGHDKEMILISDSIKNISEKILIRFQYVYTLDSTGLRINSIENFADQFLAPEESEPMFPVEESPKLEKIGHRVVEDVMESVALHDLLETKFETEPPEFEIRDVKKVDKDTVRIHVFKKLNKKAILIVADEIFSDPKIVAGKVVFQNKSGSVEVDKIIATLSDIQKEELYKTIFKE